MKRLLVEKMNTDSYFTEQTETETDTYTEDEQNRGNLKYKSIVDTSYRKPARGSVQDNMTKEEIKSKLVGYYPLKSMDEKRILTRLPLYKTWVKYINKDTKQFRSGGLLMKVVYPNYIMLVNTNKNLTWSVQLEDNIIYIRDPEEIMENVQTKRQDNTIKEKLFKMYKNGELQTKRK